MDINKKNRTDLKAFFKKNDIPTESNFADLIEAGINQKEDGIAKLPGNPLSIQAEGGSNSTQKLINFYTSFADTNPSWMINQNPREIANNAATAKPGFNIASAGGNSRLFISTNGQIGIGTITPFSALDVKGSISVDGKLRIDSSGWFNSIGNAGWRNLTHGGGWFMRDTTWLRSFGDKDVYVNKKLRADQGFEVGSNGGKFKVNTSGNVGIGTGTPASKLTVVGSSGALRLFSGKPNDHVWIGIYDGTPPNGPRQAWFGFGSSATKAFTIHNQKAGGVITLNPKGLLTNIIGDLKIDDDNSKGKGIMFARRDRPLLTNGFDVFTSGIYKGVGRWGLIMQPSILTMAIPHLTNKFFSIRTFKPNSSVGRVLMNLNATGVIHVSRLPVQLSDVSMKENIAPLNYGLKEVLKLKPVSFKWKDDLEKQNSIGLIAQDVQKVIKEIVKKGPINDKDEKLHLGYSDLIPVLINAIKELNQKIEKLSGKPE